jgi:hypothetical protein
MRDFISIVLYAKDATDVTMQSAGRNHVEIEPFVY